MVRIYSVIIDPGKRAVNYPMVNVSFTTLRVIGEPFAFVISLRRQTSLLVGGNAGSFRDNGT